MKITFTFPILGEKYILEIPQDSSKITYLSWQAIPFQNFSINKEMEYYLSNEHSATYKDRILQNMIFSILNDMELENVSQKEEIKREYIKTGIYLHEQYLIQKKPIVSDDLKPRLLKFWGFLNWHVANIFNSNSYNDQAIYGLLQFPAFEVFEVIDPPPPYPYDDSFELYGILV